MNQTACFGFESQQILSSFTILPREFALSFSLTRTIACNTCPLSNRSCSFQDLRHLALKQLVSLHQVSFVRILQTSFFSRFHLACTASIVRSDTYCEFLDKECIRIPTIFFRVDFNFLSPFVLFMNPKLLICSK